MAQGSSTRNDTAEHAITGVACWPFNYDGKAHTWMLVSHDRSTNVIGHRPPVCWDQEDPEATAARGMWRLMDFKWKPQRMEMGRWLMLEE